MPRIPYRFPAKGEDAVADRIRERRGPARGLTSLDGTLLNAPMVADGWNTFIGTLRQRNSLPDDIRELLILRVAAVNRAAFEWVHHEHVGRHAGLTYEQLSLIGSPASDDRSQAFELPSTPVVDTLSPLQLAALKFADASTRQIAVPQDVFDELRAQLAAELERNPGRTGPAGSGPVTVERQLLEATTTVGAYNMVSRLLVALDVDDKSEMVTPVPVVARVQVGATSEESLHAVFVPAAEPTDKTIILVNSLMTNYKMWRHVWDRLAKTYNVIMYDQRGHGGSFTPRAKCKLEELADDVVKVLQHFNVKQAHAIIGVSQGGATTLNVALKYPSIATKFISCDTQAKSPEANIKAWDDRIVLAKKEGMGALAQATIPRWFANDSLDQERDGKWLYDGVVGTTVEGFASSAGALQGYDLLGQGLVDALAARSEGQVLLVAGELDGALPKGLQTLADEVNAKNAGAVQVEIVAGGGHLPMVNRADEWTDKVLAFLKD